MKIEKQTVGDVVVLTFAGEFDAFGDASVLEEIDGLIEGSTRAVFNFRDLTFISSSALGYLLKAVKTLRDAGGDLVYSEPAQSFRRIIDVYGVAEVFRVFASDHAALAHFERYGAGEKTH